MVYLIFSILFILLAITPTIGLLPYESLFDNQYGVWGYLLVGITITSSLSHINCPFILYFC